MGKNISDLPDHYTPPPQTIEESTNGQGLRIGLICARFNQRITASLLMGAMDGLTQHGVALTDITTYWVPGAFEVPVMAEKVFPNVDALIAIACVIQGDTPHFDYVCSGITQGLTLANHVHQKPGIFCVLSTNTVEQAMVRAKPHCTSNKGYEAALSAIEMSRMMGRVLPQ